jgi:hypothetical protein
MVSAVGNSPSVLAPSQSQQSSQSKSADTAFQQSVDQYLQDASSGGGSSTGANPTQTLSSDLMSSLLQMQQ